MKVPRVGYTASANRATQRGIGTAVFQLRRDGAEFFMDAGDTSECDDSILICCPTCGKLFQPDRPLNDDFSRYVLRGALAGECPNRKVLPEVVRD